MPKRRKKNPIAKNLNLNKPKIIPDKRRKVREKLQEQEYKENENRETYNQNSLNIRVD